MNVCKARFRILAVLAISASSVLGATMQARADSLPVRGPVQVADAAKGRVERVSVHGRSLESNLEGDSADRMVSVYLPAAYAREPRRRFAVLYLLHGFTDSDDRWFGLKGPHFVNLPESANRVMAQGVAPYIIVMPNAYTRYLGSMYSSSATIGDWESFVAQDLVAYIDAHYRTLATRESRGIAGHSMGGYGALRIALRHPDVYSSVYALNPCCLAVDGAPGADAAAKAAAVHTPEDLERADFQTKAILALSAAWAPNPARPPTYFDLPVVDGKPVPGVLEKWAANSPLSMVDQYVPNLRRLQAIGFDAGDHDLPNIQNTVETLDRMLSAYGIAHGFEVYPGDHVNRVVERLETRVLPMFGVQLRHGH